MRSSYSAILRQLKILNCKVYCNSGSGGGGALVMCGAQDTFTPTEGQTTFTTSQGYTIGNIWVFYNGSKLTNDQFIATDGTTVTLLFTPLTTDIIEIDALCPLSDVIHDEILFQTNGVDNGSQSLLNLVQGRNITITDDGLGNITFDVPDSGTGGVDRFGIEDNLGIQDRAVDMGNFFLYLTNLSEYNSSTGNSFDEGTTIYQEPTEIDLYLQQGAVTAQVALLPSEGITLNTTEQVKVQGTSGVVVENAPNITQTFSIPANGDYYIPVSVNGNFADSTGEITLSVDNFWKTVLTCGYQIGQVNASTTTFGQLTGNNGGFQAETNKFYGISEDCTVERLFISTTTAQPATGNLVVTIRLANGGDTSGTNTVLTVTIPAGSPAGVYSDTVNSFTMVAGQKLSLQFANAATSASATVSSTAVSLVGT